MRRPARLFWPLAFLVTLTDCTTKRIVEAGAGLEHASREVAGDVLRFTLLYNPGAAFSSRYGPHQRWVLIAVALVILALLVRFYRATATRGRLHVAALALVAGGAAGNLLDRLRSPRGVVDFIDVGVGDARFWVFNLADVGVSVGAVLLAVTMWRATRDERDGASLGAPAD